MQKVDEGDHYASCDFKFMLGVIYKLGNSTHIPYRIFWGVDINISYLVVDNS